ncbi:MAG: hypothetical protein JSV56_11290 [Methanomassiliicoccales archaeon]|nr:MAG: hypothetical protein JSV56_11290 [Methanomassiliicoccales archaeon]
MTSLIPPGKDISVLHLNADWGYIAYIEKKKDVHGEPTYQVVRVPLGDGYRRKRPKRRTEEPTF